MSSLQHLQKHIPWTIAYSPEFESFANVSPLRRVTHDVLHVMMSLGRIASECEASDHGLPRKLTGDELACEVADLVICALHIARLDGFDLEQAVIRNSEARNGVKIPPEASWEAQADLELERTNARRVIVESSFAGDVAVNRAYAVACVRDCLLRGEAPFASHLLYTEALDDTIESEREHGITAGFAWRSSSDATVVYTDRGISGGMRRGIEHAQALGHVIEYRTIEGWA